MRSKVQFSSCIWPHLIPPSQDHDLPAKRVTQGGKWDHIMGNKYKDENLY
jgi:hypothetical protein